MENSQLLEHIGKTKTQKLLNEISKSYFELKEKSKNRLNPMCIVSVEKENEIKSIGMSCVNDLFLNNFGLFFGALLSGNRTTQIVKNQSGSNKNLRMWGNSNMFNVTDVITVGGMVKIGSGSTPASRSDFTIQTPFGNSPENSLRNTGNAGYNSGLGQVTIPTLISPTGGAGSISEAGLFLRCETIGTGDQIMMSHDNISPVANFSIGDSINVEYILGLS